MSRKNVLLSTYHTSSLNLSAQLNAFRPFIWAHPVMPGLNSCLLACISVYSGKYRINKGLGPTRLISPFRMFQSSGSSSRLVERKNAPKRVSRSPSGRSFPSASFESNMVRNLIMLNGMPLRPGRCCTNSTGAPKFLRTRIATTSSAGQNKDSAKILMIRSNKRFATLSPLLDYLTRGSIELGLGVFGATISVSVSVSVSIPIPRLTMFKLRQNHTKHMGMNGM